MEKLLFSTDTNRKLAKKIIQKVDFEIGKAEVGKFSDGEIKVFLKESVEGKKVFVLGSSFPPADNLLELLILINTLKVNGAEKIVAIIPYFAYAKADHIDPPGAPLSAKLMVDFIKQSGAEKVISVNMHSRKAESFFGPMLTNLDAIPILAEEFKKIKISDLVIVSPDEGGLERAETFARTLKAKNIAYIKKYHPGLEKISSQGIEGEVKGKNVVIVDDMIQSGGTIINAINELERAGAKDIYLAVVHLVRTGPGMKKLAKEKRIKKIILTNTIPTEIKLPANFKEIDISEIIIKKLIGDKA